MQRIGQLALLELLADDTCAPSGACVGLAPDGTQKCSGSLYCG